MIFRKPLVLIIGIALVLASFAVFALGISGTIPVVQKGWFLGTSLPGLALIGLYATVGVPGPDFQKRSFIWILVKILIVIMLLTNVITMFNSLSTAQLELSESLGASIMSLVDVGLALAGFAFLLVVWHGRRWSVWAYGVTSFVLCTMKFVGHLPVFPILFEFSFVIVLFYLLGSSWGKME
jgi:hypothetical protein